MPPPAPPPPPPERNPAYRNVNMTNQIPARAVIEGCLDSMERGTVEWNSGTMEWNSGMVERWNSGMGNCD